MIRMIGRRLIIPKGDTGFVTLPFCDSHEGQAIAIFSVKNMLTKKTVIENNAFFQGHCISISEEEKFKIQSEKFLQNQSIISKVNI